jgi:hypothetical protein
MRSAMRPRDQFLRAAGLLRQRIIGLLVAVLTLALAGTGCARPYRGPKTLAAIGASVLVTGAALWVAGDRGQRQTLTRIGAVSALTGGATVLVAGGWLAASASCNADPDCPEEEACKEIPAPPGREPYKQCM